MQIQSITQHTYLNNFFLIWTVTIFPLSIYSSSTIQWILKQHLEVKGGRKETSKEAAEVMVGSVSSHLPNTGPKPLWFKQGWGLVLQLRCVTKSRLRTSKRTCSHEPRGERMMCQEMVISWSARCIVTRNLIAYKEEDKQEHWRTLVVVLGCNCPLCANHTH